MQQGLIPHTAMASPLAVIGGAAEAVFAFQVAACRPSHSTAQHSTAQHSTAQRSVQT